MGIGYRIKEAREHLCLTQTELGNLVGVTGSAITNYEKETSHPKEQVIYKLMEVLDVDANYLFQDVVKVPKKNNQLTIEECKHLEKYRSLDDFGRETVDLILDRELQRKESLSKKEALIQELQEAPLSSAATVRYIHYYQCLASAGTGQLVFDSLPVDMLEIPDIPEYRKVKYAVGVNGRSMEPEYKNGDIVLVAPDIEVSVGDIGIFIDKADAYIKKRGEDALISLNPEFNNIPLTHDTRCLGLVVDKYAPLLDSADEAALQFGRELLGAENLFNKRLG